MKRSLLLSLFILLTFACTAQGGDFNLTSYYPAPAGTYFSVTLSPQAALTATNCELGTIYSNSNDNSELYYCGLSGGLAKFNPIAGTWTQSVNSLYLTDTSTPENKKVGIGTQSPTFKLTLINDGGIFSDDYMNTFTSALPVSGAGTRLIWYPYKKAFRAGYVPGTEWDDANIGAWSVAMGYGNKAKSDGAIIWGGQNNIAEITIGAPRTPAAPFSMIAGGKNNSSHGSLDQILGGENNSASDWSRVSGQNNTAANIATIGGGSNNTVSSGVTPRSGGTVSGGNQNSVFADSGTISGGENNNVGIDSNYGTVSGGSTNIISDTKLSSTISGGENNTANSNYSIIGGGHLNTVNSDYGTISGGDTNSILVGALNSTISGGQNNQASGLNSSVGGGKGNIASGSYSIVVGGNNNAASGSYSIVVGGDSNSVAGDFSLVAGHNMSLNNTASKSFVWGHSDTPLGTPIGTSDTFLIYSGNVGIRDTNPAAMLEINGNSSTDDYLAVSSSSAAVGDKFIIKNNGRVGVGQTNPQYPLEFGNGAYVTAAGNFVNASSRTYKENISDLQLSAAMDTFSKLTPVQYNYKNDPKEQYIGFIAEDVPDLVADKDRKGLAPMDIAAVLTKVVAHQQEILKQQKHDTEILLQEFNELKRRIK